MASSRFPGKPLARILGKEMLHWVYEHGRESRRLERLYVATDSDHIAEFCEGAGIPWIMTSEAHRNCAERSQEAWEKLGGDLVLEIQGDEPTLRGPDIDAFLEDAADMGDADVVILCTELDPAEAADEHKVKVVIGAGERAVFFSRAQVPHGFRGRPVSYFQQIGLYLWKPQALSCFRSVEPGPLELAEDTHMLRLVEGGFTARVVHTATTPVGVDLPSDIGLAEEALRAMGRVEAASETD